MLIHSSVAVLLGLCSLAIACKSSPTEPNVAQQVAAIVPDVFGSKDLPKKGCEGAKYREFDFWVGQWDVYGGSTFVGTNIVERELDGCIVEENWIDPSGGRGRSINMYDVASGKWSQTWTGSGGAFGAFVFLEGGLVDGTMHVEGSRFTPAGFEIFNTINWTPLSGGRVRQFGELRQGTGPLQQTFDIEYRPVSAVTPIVEVPRTLCANRAQSRQFDFALGSWRVAPTSGAVATTVTYSTDLSGCLIEERLSGPGGYEAWSFNTWHTVTQKWHRTYMDNRGLRLVLSGGMVNGAMVMTGRYPMNGSSIDYRITWTPDGERLQQRWETSHDLGTTWQQVLQVEYAKQS